MKLKILGILLVAAVVSQFIPYGKDHTNPAVQAEPEWDSSRTRELFSRTCADCHSHETIWPAYSNYAPVSWLIQSDIDEGREHFNVSNWGLQQKNKANEAAEAVREGEMPPWFYLIPHADARLSDSEEGELIRGLIATFGDKKAESQNKD